MFNLRMQEPIDLAHEAIDERLDAVEAVRDEDRLATLEGIYNGLESALAEIEGDQAVPPGR